MDARELTDAIRELVDTGAMDWETAYKEAQLEMEHIMNVRVDNMNVSMFSAKEYIAFDPAIEEISLDEAEAEGYSDDDED